MIVKKLLLGHYPPSGVRRSTRSNQGMDRPIEQALLVAIGSVAGRAARHAVYISRDSDALTFSFRGMRCSAPIGSVLPWLRGSAVTIRESSGALGRPLLISLSTVP